MTTPLLGLSEIAEGVVNQATIHNTALRQMEARSFRVLSLSTIAPPATPAESHSYIIPAGATGVWASKTNQIASWIGGAWVYYTPVEGIGGIWVNDLDTAYSFDGTNWVASGGIGATAPFVDGTSIVKGSVDATKQLKIEVDGFTTATTHTLTPQNKSYVIADKADLDAHIAAADPHAQYALETAIGVASGIASLGADGKVPAAQLPASATTGGTVTSVALTAPAALFAVAGSPVTTTGTLDLSLTTQSANTVLAGPASGVAATPTMRALVAADLPAQPFDVHAFYPGIPSASAKVLRIPIARAVTFPANFAGSYFTASANAAGTTVFDVQKNGVSIGSISIAAGGTVVSFATTGGTSKSFAAGDVLSIIAPASPDATLSDTGFALAGTR